MIDYSKKWVNFIDNYWVSDDGAFQRRYKNGKIKNLKTYTKSNNRHNLVIKIHQKEVNARRLVWETFNGAIPEGYIVRNKHGYKTMCDIYNLECVPRIKEQRLGGMARGKRVKDKDTGRIYKSARTAEKYLHISAQSICDYCNGRIKKPLYNLEWFSED